MEISRDTAVMLKVQMGVQPSRPSASSTAWGTGGLTETIWSLMQTCWDQEPDNRPTIQKIISHQAFMTFKDKRPVDRDTISPAHFRDSVGGRSDLPSIADFEKIMYGLDLGTVGPI